MRARPRRPGLLAAIAVAVALLFAADAQPRTVYQQSGSFSQWGSPALAGDRAVWVGQGGVDRGNADGSVTRLFDFGPPYPHGRVRLAASATHIMAFLYGYRGQNALWVTTANGVRQVDGPGSGCETRNSADLDGERIAFAGRCGGTDGMFVLDLDSGNPPRLVVADSLGELDTVRVAGEFVAWERRTAESPPSGQGEAIRHTEVVVFDLNAGRTALRLDLAGMGADVPFCINGRIDATCNSALNLDLQPDGTVAAAFGTTFGPQQHANLAWASPASPSWHPVPGDLSSTDLSLWSNLAFVRLHQPRGAAVIGFNGQVVDVPDRTFLTYGADTTRFDGRHLAWAGRGGVYLDAFPSTPPVVSAARVTTGVTPGLSVRVSQPARLTIVLDACRGGRGTACGRPRRVGRLTRSLSLGRNRLSITGAAGEALRRRGRHRLTLRARNRTGRTSRPLRIVVNRG